VINTRSMQKCTIASGIACLMLYETIEACGQAPPVLWTYDVGSTIATSPTLATDGTLYVQTANALIAVTNNGVVASNRWSFPVALWAPGTEAVDVSGTVYLTSSDGNLYAINPDGSLKWKYAAAGVGSTPAIGRDGTIYVSATGFLNAVTPAGQMKWRAFIGEDAGNCSPTIGSDGTIYIGSVANPALFAINADGTQKWSNTGSYAPGDSEAIGADGTLYAVLRSSLTAFGAGGSIIWQTSTNQLGVGAAPALLKNGTILVCGGNSAAGLSAFSPDGFLLWQILNQTGREPPQTTPAIDSSGVIYHCVSNGVWAINAQGSVLWNLNAPGIPGPGGFFAGTSPTIGPDGTIYVALSTVLYAIAGTNKLSDSAWPMLHQNPRHTGKVEKPALGKPQKRSDSGFQFQLYSQLGSTNTIQVSSDLYGWTSWTDLLVTNVPMDVVDFSATNSLSRFYRAVDP